MAKREEKIPFRIFINDTKANKTYEWDSLTESQTQGFISRMSENLGLRMSDYYTSNPEQFERL